jgi:hypothetical protein
MEKQRKNLSLFSALLIGGLFLFCAFHNVSAADPVFNSLSNDKETLRLENRTTNPGGGANWSDPISASAGDAVSFDVYYHNATEGTVAQNTKVKITFPTVATNAIVSTVTISADNAQALSDTGTINLSSSQTLTFENVAQWYPNQQVSVATPLTATVTGNSLEVNIGDIAGGWPAQGHVVFRATISNNSNGPTVSAGSDIQVNESQSIALGGASATDPNGSALTYSWTCTGGTLSDSHALNPTYAAPSVSSDTTYTCTLTATNSNGLSNSDDLNVLVRNTNVNSLQPVVSAGSDIQVNEMDSAALSGASATDPSGLAMTYSWTCTGGTLSDSHLLNPTYAAPSVSSDTTYACTLTATNSNGLSGSGSTNIVVKNIGGSGGGSSSGGSGGGSTNWISVDAGKDMEVGQGQSIALNGYAYSQYGYALTYSWTCTGGTVSPNNSLAPTYTADNVLAGNKYVCTLTVNASNGYSVSDSMNITVTNSSGRSSGPLSVATSVPDNVTVSSAVLNGTLVSDGGSSVNLRFAWGRTSSYGDYTGLAYAKHSGDAAASAISGLLKGKAYHYRVEAISDDSKYAYGQDISFVTQPDSPAGVSASGISSSQISVKWIKGDSSCYTMVVRNANGYPADTNDGTVVYYGTGSGFTDNNLSQSTTYYYRVWGVACDQGLSSYSDSSNSKASAATKAGSVPAVSSASENQEQGMVVEVLGSNITKGEKSLSGSISAAPSDEIEIDILVTPVGTKSLRGVEIKNILPGNVSYIETGSGSQSYAGSMDTIDVGNIPLGRSEAIVIKAKIGPKDNFSYGNNELKDSVTVSASNIGATDKSIDITVNRGLEASAAIFDFLGKNIYRIAMAFMAIAVLGLLAYIIMDKRRKKED